MKNTSNDDDDHRNDEMIDICIIAEEAAFQGKAMTHEVCFMCAVVDTCYDWQYNEQRLNFFTENDWSDVIRSMQRKEKAFKEMEKALKKAKLSDMDRKKELDYICKIALFFAERFYGGEKNASLYAERRNFLITKIKEFRNFFDL